ncbi:DUF1471 domain-containing protein [Enterobacteriaceae bacterium G50]|nr:DUF1471 domain-containing protein [Enterobacteriaceae bacterium G50]
MSMNAKIITALFLSIISTNTFAATEILKPTPDMKEIARISLSEKITNPAGIEDKVREKADSLQGNYYQITSISGRDYLHATAIIYK